jgi:hypothetical protein
MARRRVGVRGFTDKNGRKVHDYSQRRQTGQSWTGGPKRRKPRNLGPKLTAGGAAKNVAQTFTVAQFRRGQADQQARRDWHARATRDRTPGTLATASMICTPAGIIVTATATGLVVLLGAAIAMLGATFAGASLYFKIREANRS